MKRIERKRWAKTFADPFDYFLLDAESGELRTAKPLDREALENSTGVLTFVVQTREVVDGQPGNDKSTVSTAEATVTIKDVNDEPPSFNRKEYSISIPENIADGTPLPHLDMMVRDPDVVSIPAFFSYNGNGVVWGSFAISDCCTLWICYKYSCFN